MKITTKPAAEVLGRAMLLNFNGTTIGRTMRWMGWLMIAVGVLDLLTSPTFDFLFLLLLLLGVWFLVGQPWLIRRSARVALDKNPILREEQTFIFGEDAMHAVAAGSTARIPWQNIHEVRETEEFLLIFPTSQTMHVLPKKDFSPVDLSQFRALIQRVPGLNHNIS